MGYQPDEDEAMRAAWLAAVPAEITEGWKADLGIYLAHERVKSAIVDTIRYTKLIASTAASGKRAVGLAGKLADKLTAASTAVGGWPTRQPTGSEEILTLITNWARSRSS